MTDLNGKYDARQPLAIGHARIHDYHATHRILTVPEVFIHSSNIGTARMALDVGIESAPGVPQADGPVRQAGDGTARGRHASAPRPLGQAHHRHRRLRSCFRHRAAAGGVGDRCLPQSRAAGAPDLPQARRPDRQGAAGAAGVGGDQREDALPVPPQRRGRHRHQGRCAGLPGRRQDGDVGKGGEGPLQQQAQPQLVHRRLSHGRSHLCGPGHAGRAAAAAGDLWLCDIGLERGAHRRGHHQARRAAARYRAATDRRRTPKLAKQAAKQ